MGALRMGAPPEEEEAGAVREKYKVRAIHQHTSVDGPMIGSGWRARRLWCRSTVANVSPDVRQIGRGQRGVL